MYSGLGFLFFPCNADKTPAVPSWTDPLYHISRDQAEERQRAGGMVGAWIPADILVLDLDKHDGKPNGVETFNGIKQQYNVQAIAFQDGHLLRPNEKRRLSCVLRCTRSRFPPRCEGARD